MPPSDALFSRIQEETDKLGQFFDRITSCHVVVEAPHRHHHRGEPFHIRVALMVPGKELVVSHEPPAREAIKTTGFAVRTHKQDELQVAHKDAYVAIRDSFAAMRRQLQDYVHGLRHV